MKTRRDFLKRTALLGASAFMAPSLLGRESDGDCFFSQESTSSMLVPMGDALKITGTFLDQKPIILTPLELGGKGNGIRIFGICGVLELTRS